MTTEELCRELRELSELASYYGCEHCAPDEEDDELSDRLRALEHRLALDALLPAPPAPVPSLSLGPSDRDAKATPHDAPPSSTTART